MSEFVVRKAERKKARARLALTAPSGGGKTYSALLVARGLVGPAGHIIVIDTERNSAELYDHLTPFEVIEFNSPYTPERCIEAIHAAEQAGADVIIFDSITHEWNGVGGVLDTVDRMPGQDTRAKWKQMTPRHNAFVEAMLSSTAHILVTMRSKSAYVETIDKNGKKKYEKSGLEPQQRDGLEFEFTAVLDMDQQHIATASKDRTSFFDNQYEKLTVETGVKLHAWLESGAEHHPHVTPASTPAPRPAAIPAPDNGVMTAEQCARIAEAMKGILDVTGMGYFGDLDTDSGKYVWNREHLSDFWFGFGVNKATDLPSSRGKEILTELRALQTTLLAQPIIEEEAQ